MEFTFYIANAFINPDKSFSGNPAAVVILRNDNDISDEKKQSIATQFNLSETVFVSKCNDDAKSPFLIRWFSPVGEIKLCGHATMAATYILFTEKHIYRKFICSSEPIQFKSRFGESLEVTFNEQWTTMNFPQHAPAPIKSSKWLTDIQEAVFGDAAAELIVEAQFPSTLPYLLLRVKEEVDIFAVEPNFSRLLQVANKDQIILVLVTNKANFATDKVHFFARAFVPWHGANEDPVCGSAFTVSTPYWSKVYREEYNEKLDILYAFQASKRTGIIRTEILADNRMLITGKANKFCSGTFYA